MQDILTFPLDIIRKDMRRLNIPGVSKLDSNNQLEYVNLILAKLILKEELLPFPRTSLRLGIKTSMKREGEPFSSFPKSKREIIRHALRKEAIPEDLIRNGYKYRFEKFKVEDLPRTYQEETYGTYVNFVEMDVLQKIVTYDLYKVHLLEKSIRKSGYKSNKPIMVKMEVSHQGTNYIHVLGGHHRLQALRNLDFYHEIPKRFKVPCIIMI
jgi:hypothetical protein